MKNIGEGVGGSSSFSSARHMRHVTPPSAVPSVDCACFPSPQGCTTTPLPPAEVRRAFASLLRQTLTFQNLAASFASLCVLLSTLVLCFQSFAASFPKTPGVGGGPGLHPPASTPGCWRWPRGRKLD